MALLCSVAFLKGIVFAFSRKRGLYIILKTVASSWSYLSSKNFGHIFQCCIIEELIITLYNVLPSPTFSVYFLFLSFKFWNLLLRKDQIGLKFFFMMQHFCIVHCSHKHKHILKTFISFASLYNVLCCLQILRREGESLASRPSEV